MATISETNPSDIQHYNITALQHITSPILDAIMSSSKKLLEFTKHLISGKYLDTDKSKYN